nr:hypothetical protein [uncultured Ruegeria sp.]
MDAFLTRMPDRLAGFLFQDRRIGRGFFCVALRRRVLIAWKKLFNNRRHFFLSFSQSPSLIPAFWHCLKSETELGTQI